MSPGQTPKPHGNMEFLGEAKIICCCGSPQSHKGRIQRTRDPYLQSPEPQPNAQGHKHRTGAWTQMEEVAGSVGGSRWWKEDVPSTSEHSPQRKLDVLLKPCGLMGHPYKERCSAQYSNMAQPGKIRLSERSCPQRADHLMLLS